MPEELLPFHPWTGLRAIGIVGGKPVYPIIGASEDDDDDDEPALIAGTLEAANNEIRRLTRQKRTFARGLKQQKDEVAKLTAEKLEADKKLADFDKLSKEHAEMLTAQETATFEALKTAAAKAAGLPDWAAARLNGTTEDELKADALAVGTSMGIKPPAPGQQQQQAGFVDFSQGQGNTGGATTFNSSTPLNDNQLTEYMAQQLNEALEAEF